MCTYTLLRNVHPSRRAIPNQIYHRLINKDLIRAVVGLSFGIKNSHYCRSRGFRR